MVPKAYLTSVEEMLTYLFAYVVVPDGIPAQPHGTSGPLGQLMKSSWYIIKK